MGAPACDYFCDNGHHIMGCSHHEVLFNSPEVCDICGSKKIKNHIEWGDKDYHQYVPLHPVKHIRRIKRIEEAIDKEGNPIEAYRAQSIPIYDVKKLFEDRE